MRSLIFILISLLIHSKDSTVVTGMVAIDNDPLVGCEVKVLQNGIRQFTDSDGNFRLVTSDLKKMTLVINSLDKLTCKVVLDDIPLDSADINLGTIPLVYNEMVSIADYEKFDSNKRKKYEEIRHWTELLGYINKTSVDTTALRMALWTHKRIKYRYDSVDNAVVVNYKDWRK